MPAFTSGETLTGGTSSATVTSTSAGYTVPANVQGNGFGNALSGLSTSGGVLRSPVAAGTGVLGSYQLLLSDTYNYLMGFEYDITPPGITTAIADGSFVVGANYQITVVGTQNFVATFTNGTPTTSQVNATIGGVLVQVNQAATATLSVAALAAAINATAGLSQVARASASGAVLTISLYNPNPSVAVPVTVSQVTDGSWALALANQASMPATGWHRLGVPASVVPAVGVVFQALQTGSLTHAGDGKAASAFALVGTAAADGASQLVLQGLVNPGLRSSYAAGLGGYLNMQAQLSATGAAADLAAGSVVRLSLLLRNSTVKGKGE